MRTESTWSRRIAFAFVGALGLVSLGCASSDSVQGSNARDQRDEDLAARRFDIGTKSCGTSLPACTLDGEAYANCCIPGATDSTGKPKCFCDAEFDHLDYGGVSHFVGVGDITDSATAHARQQQVTQAGNFQAVYVDRMNDGYNASAPETSGADYGAALISNAQNDFPDGVPQWWILNEIMVSGWSDPGYQSYVIALATQMHDEGYAVIVAAPFDKPGHFPDAWTKLTNVAYVAAESVVTGADVAAMSDPVGGCKAIYSEMLTAYQNLVPDANKDKFMLLDQFADTNAKNSIPYGRYSSAGADVWQAAIRARVAGGMQVAFAGYLSYAWESDQYGDDAATRLSFEDAYATAVGGTPYSPAAAPPPAPPPPPPGAPSSSPSSPPPPAPTPIPSAPTSCGAIMPGQGLPPGGEATSCDGRFVLDMQTDGNLVLYELLAAGPKALWASNTFNKGGYVAWMQGDGNLVVYTQAGVPVWASNTSGNPGAYLALQNDGNAVVYSGSSPIWATNTCCK